MLWERIVPGDCVTNSMYGDDLKIGQPYPGFVCMGIVISIHKTYMFRNWDVDNDFKSSSDDIIPKLISTTIMPGVTVFWNDGIVSSCLATYLRKVF